MSHPNKHGHFGYLVTYEATDTCIGEIRADNLEQAAQKAALLFFSVTGVEPQSGVITVKRTTAKSSPVRYTSSPMDSGCKVEVVKRSNFTAHTYG